MIGFTGTRSGLTPAQADAIERVLAALVALFSCRVVVHGDCTGADDHFDRIAAAHGLDRRSFPSTKAHFRAHTERRGCVELRAPAPPLTRNRWIVQSSRVLIGAPGGEVEEPKGGTWHTIRLAREARLPHVYVTPSAKVVWRQ